MYVCVYVTWFIDAEICDWLGRRYAEKGDFDKSRRHFMVRAYMYVCMYVRMHA